MNFQQYLKQVKSEIREVSVDEVNAKRPPVLIDVREGDEYNEGYIPGATWIPRGKLELRIEDAVPDREQEIVLYCAGGNRSALAAKALAELGYGKVSSMAGGSALRLPLVHTTGCAECCSASTCSGVAGSMKP